MQLLHLEDSDNDAELVHRLVHQAWPECRFLRAETRVEFEAALVRGDFNLILSDYTMPDLLGLDALDLARRQCPEKPFIFLSGTIGEERAIEALRRGASDYVIKDRPNRIIPAIRQALARVEVREQQRQAGARIREQAALLDQARDAICVTDLEFRISYWNAGAERLFGWSADEARGRELRELLFPEDPTAFDEARRELLPSGEWRGELRPRDRQGAPLVIESRWTLVRDGDGALQHYLLINSDVTERRKLELQLLSAQRLDSIGTLAGGIAHDLNNVLSPIIIAAGMLRGRQQAEADRELVDAIETGAQHGAALIKQLLDFARGAEGTMVDVQPQRLVAGLHLLLQATLPRAIQVSYRCGNDVWPVHGDPTQLNQVLLNLCINARDAMPQGGWIEVAADNIQVDAALARELVDGRPGPFVRFSVTDTGVGIRPEILDKIFDPFFTTKGVGLGTGLGLSTVRGIAKGHRGCLQVESAVGSGTTFRLYLPALLTPTREPAAVPPPPPPGAGTGSGEHILVIDDDHAMRTMLRLVLESAGYPVILAASGEAGLESFENHRAEIALVITDIMMPAMSGIEVILTLRRRAPAMGIIAISGLMEASRDAIARLPGPAVTCLAKPIRPEVLFAAIKEVLKK